MIVDHSITISVDLFAICEQNTQTAFDFKLLPIALYYEHVGAVVKIGLDSVPHSH